MSKKPLIKINNLSKEFVGKSSTNVLALDRISLEINEKEFVSIIGPSGCGKTTLLRLIGGLIYPTAGNILINGSLPEQARRNRQISFVFQDPVLFPWRNVIDNIKLPGEIFSSEKTKNRAQQLVELVGLAGFEKSLPRELSGGMQSRVAIARALSYEPKILLMDEPFGDLDEITRDKMTSELLRAFEKTGVTIIYVTHNIVEAVFISDKVVVLSQRPGKIVKLINTGLDRPREFSLRKNIKFIELVEDLRKLLY